MTTHASGAKLAQADLNASGLRVAVIASRFNHFLVEKLVDGAVDALVRHGAKAEDQSVIWVPGAWELPVVTQRIARSRKFDAIVCVGVLIKGSTHHFDFVANEASKGIAQVSLETSVPVTMGILTTDTLAQAIERAGTTMGNQGWNASLAAIEVANLFRQLD
jgi:6,7-dimethyl-8-ribityllumazine synthase